MSKHYRLVMEVDVELHDEAWTEQDLIDNAVLYFQTAIDRAEQEGRDPAPAYSVDTSDITLWTQAGYADDYRDDLAGNRE